jgi:hypothetical protein
LDSPPGDEDMSDSLLLPGLRSTMTPTGAKHGWDGLVLCDAVFVHVCDRNNRSCPSRFFSLFYGTLIFL